MQRSYGGGGGGGEDLASFTLGLLPSPSSLPY